MIRKNSLSFRIIIRVLLITISLLVFILAIYSYFNRNIIKEAARENAIHVAGSLTASIEQVLVPMEHIPKSVGNLIEIELPDKESLFEILETILRNNDEVYGAIIAFEPDFFPGEGRYFAPYAYKDGDDIYSLVLGSTDYEYFYMDWYQIPATLRESYWSEPYFDEGGGNIIMSTFSMPFYVRQDGERRFAGIATVDVDMDFLTRTVADVQIFESGYAFLISRNGVALTHPDRSQIMNESIFSASSDWGEPILREIGRELREGKSNFREYNIEREGKNWIYYTNLPGSRYSIGVVYPNNEMFASLRQLNTILILLIIAGLGVLIVAVVQNVNRLASPLSEFTRSTMRIAEGNFNVRLPEISTKDEMQELHNAFSYMQNQLSEYIENLKETTAAKEKIESELRIAREIQLSMIPNTFPPFPDMPQVDLFAMLKSAREVGGDLYDFFAIDKHRFCFAIGDVSGKGVPASLFMAVSRTLLRSIADKEKSPAKIAQSLNASLAWNNESCMFVTFFMGIIDLRNGEINYINAGHNPPVLIRKNGEVSMFETAGTIPFGLNETFAYPERTLTIKPGDKVFSYTDGVNEAENASSELFGDERMLNVINENKNKNPRMLISEMESAIEQHVAGFPQSDDITMMVMEYKG
ncbi:MAG: SpoIIE family protein phosphatase [Bacteroidales bacterium]|nr:SpoIIE family protein phosphatase [Bacteroidales bacterium]